MASPTIINNTLKNLFTFILQKSVLITIYKAKIILIVPKYRFANIFTTVWFLLKTLNI